MFTIISCTAFWNKDLDVYHAIADGNRRKLLELVSHRECSVQELVPHFDMTIGAISQHLKILLANGLVTRRRQGRYRLYRSDPAPLKEVHDWTEQCRRLWESRLDRLGDYLDET